MGKLPARLELIRTMESRIARQIAEIERLRRAGTVRMRCVSSAYCVMQCTNWAASLGIDRSAKRTQGDRTLMPHSNFFLRNPSFDSTASKEPTERPRRPRDMSTRSCLSVIKDEVRGISISMDGMKPRVRDYLLKVITPHGG